MAVVKGTANSYIGHPSEPKTLKPQDTVTELCRSSLHNPVLQLVVILWLGAKIRLPFPLLLFG